MTSTTIVGVAVFDGEQLLDGRFDVTFDQSSITAGRPQAIGDPRAAWWTGAAGHCCPG